MKIHTAKRKKISGALRGVIYLPEEDIGKRYFLITPYELNKYNKSYWFLRNLFTRLNKVTFLK